jgi:multiple sugar transport system permease protein
VFDVPKASTSPWQDLRKRWPQILYCLVVLVPITALYVIIRIIPICETIYMSFFNWNLAKPIKPFIGLTNFQNLFTDELFLSALQNTIWYAFVTVTITLAISLLLAVLLNRTMKWKMDAAYKFLYFLPVIPTLVPVSVVWKWIYDPSYGILNYVISWFGMKPQGWLINPKLAMWSIIIMSVWKGIGYYMVLFLVGLQEIPVSLYEAADIDGSSARQKFRYITIPLLRPMILFNLVMATMSAFNVFAPVYVMTTGEQGAAANPVRVIVYDMYENGFRYMKFGYASAEAVILLLIVVVFTLIQFKVFRIDED